MSNEQPETTRMDGIMGQVFPILPFPSYDPKPTSEAHLQKPYLESQHGNELPFQELDKSTCEIALAILLTRYTGTNEVAFIAPYDKEDEAQDQVDAVNGLTIENGTVEPATVAITIRVDSEQLIDDILKREHFQQRYMIRRVLDYSMPVIPGDKPQISICIVSDGRNGIDDPADDAKAQLQKPVQCEKVAITIRCSISKHSRSLLLHAHYDALVMDDKQMQRFLNQLASVVSQLQSGELNGKRVGDIVVATEDDIRQVWAWNSTNPYVETRRTCIHQLVTAQARNAPDRMALSAWDGQLTYGELDRLSSRLALHLRSLDMLVREQVVPVCFEKSKWTLVALLAVLKAGAAFTLIDATSPRERADQICQQTNATLILVSRAQLSNFVARVTCCVVVDDASVAELCSREDENHVANADGDPGDPGSLAYVLFTSGSTGTPKGSLIEHASFTSTCLAYGPSMRITQSTRALQFASYAFGACLFETLAILVHGGCVCVPSEHQRISALPDFIAREHVNWAFFTPSFLTALQPQDLLHQRQFTLLTGGEPVSADTQNVWAPLCDMINVYGQSETASACAVSKRLVTTDVRNIGQGIGARFWVTEIDNVDVLAAVGAVGELIVHGPGVGRGYLGQRDDVASPFLKTAPEWWFRYASEFASDDKTGGDGISEPQQRFFRTGDLVRYQPDGNLVHLGRIDGQVKIHGQRIEVGDVEYHVKKQLYTLQQTNKSLTDTGETLKSLAVRVAAVHSPNAQGRNVLVAFIRADAEIVNSNTRGHAAELLDISFNDGMNALLTPYLPWASRPQHYIRMRDFPATVTGKTDIKRLRSLAEQLLRSASTASIPNGSACRLSSDAALPIGGMPSFDDDPEAMMCYMWAQVLHMEPTQVNREHNFLHLGGDSIDAVRLVNIAFKSGISIALTDILEHPVLHDLVRTIRERSALISSEDQQAPKASIASPSAERLPKVAALDRYIDCMPSAAQERLYFLDKMRPDKSPWYYNIPLAVQLRGLVDISALETCLVTLERVHEALRTTFHETDFGGVMQRIEPPRSQIFQRPLHPVMSYDKARCLLEGDQKRPFLLHAEHLWRANVYPCEDGTCILSIVLHHIIADGWSVDVLCRDLSKYYAHLVQDPGVQSPHDLSHVSDLPIQYREYATLQQRELASGAFQSQIEYWKRELTDSQAAELPGDYVRPHTLSGEGGIVKFDLRGDRYRRLHQFCRDQNVTPFAVLLACFRAAHYRTTGMQDATIGIPAAGRNTPELRDLIGFFVNTQCVRLRIRDNDESFMSLVHQTKVAVINALKNQDVPFERIVSELVPGVRESSRNPLVQLMFALHGQSELGHIQLQGVESEIISDAGPGLAAWSRFDVEFHLYRREDAFDGAILFARDLFEQVTIESFLAAFLTLLDRGLEEPTTPLAILPTTVGPVNYLDELLDDSIDASYPRHASVVDMFEAQLMRTPEAEAVRDSTTSLTYAQLDYRSNLVAKWLHDCHLTAEMVVAIFAPRSCETIVTMLGILKAGLAYLPLDIKTPPGRLERIIGSLNTSCRVLLVGSNVDLPDSHIQNLDLEIVRMSQILDQKDLLDGLAGIPSLHRPSSTSLAYIMFTSGSTGAPKGVMVEHRGIVRLVCQSNVTAQHPPAAKVAHLCSLGFDASTWEIYSALLNGGTICCIDDEHVVDTLALGSVFRREAIQVTMVTPGLLKQILEYCPTMLCQLAVLNVAGARFDPRDARKARSLTSGELYNVYGPTENTVLTTTHRLLSGEEYPNGVPIGVAINATGVLVMDSQQQLVAPGIVGELVAIGDGLARGYTDHSLDEDRFILLNDGRRQVRAYRTGDLVRRCSTSNTIDYIGRADTQIKIRGQRLELAEIEHTLLECDSSIKDAAVLACVDDDKETSLVAFITPSQMDTATTSQAYSGHVHDWSSHFELSTYEEISSIDPAKLGRDFLGWKSMIDGRIIEENAMIEWLEDILRVAVPEGERAGNVLEIGTGTGMILFNLGPEMDSYVGLEPSESAVRFTTNAIKSRPDLVGKAQVRIGTALDLPSLGEIQPNLVILNSVVQYFPSVEYLKVVLTLILGLPGVRKIVFGDIRSYSLYTEFLSAKTLHALHYSASKEQFRRRMKVFQEEEEELLISPLWFTWLAEDFPEQIEYVEVLPKIMRAETELNGYRFNAVLHIKNKQEPRPTIVSTPRSDWQDFVSSGMNADILSRTLRNSRHLPWIAIGNIPYANIRLACEIAAELVKPDAESEDEQSWLSRSKEKALAQPSMSAAALIELGQCHGWNVKLSWSRQESQRGGLDAIFFQSQHAESKSVPRFLFPEDTCTTRSLLSNQPLQLKRRRALISDTFNKLRRQLPTFMIPARIEILDKMPLNASGKTDYSELKKKMTLMSRGNASPRKAEHRPRTDIETAICEEISKMLSIDSISVSDNFFDLGGHSLMATRFAVRLRNRLKVLVHVRDIFSSPVVGQLASLLESRIHHVEAPGTSVNSLYAPFQLLGLQDESSISIKHEIESQLDPAWRDHVYDVYPATQTQEVFLRGGFQANTIYLDLPGSTDCDRLKQCCIAVVQRYDILRTLFVQQCNVLYQVVLDQASVPINIHQVHASIDDATCSVRDKNLQKFLPLRSISLCIDILVDKLQSIVRLMVQMPHSMYDGMSLEELFRSILDNYQGLEIPPSPPFAWYVKHMCESRREGYKYWREVLHQSCLFKPTNLEFNGPADAGYRATRTIAFPSGNRIASSTKYTNATIFTAAWAKVLSRESGRDDVTFGRLVSGRQALPVAHQSIMGPCINVAPVRIRFDNAVSSASLLQEGDPGPLYPVAER
ncbi:hypothetical protein AC578_4676 [Pseudocercospora eumusae]|uniref:Carrier domain-containing protein n=1 Tax=Pseudocercospora eumusae TaxID=321146 RepID=A0A139H7B6_9PEZI|nr:hypothetical protein AC578_4676 [Pseudocercospora eumusae]